MENEVNCATHLSFHMNPVPHFGEKTIQIEMSDSHFKKLKNRTSDGI